MTDKEFEKEIDDKLQGLPVEEITKYAWECAVLALPVIGINGNFDFWRENDKQKFLFSIFSSLDKIVFALEKQEQNVNLLKESITLRIARNSINLTESKENLEVIAGALDAIRFAVDATKHINVLQTSYMKVVSSYIAKDLSRLVRNIISKTNKIKKNDLSYDLFENVLDKMLCKNSSSTNFNYFKIYGDIWSSFQNALQKAGFLYWNKLFTDYYTSQKGFDLQSVQKRINIPEEIKSKGAARVSQYLEEMEEKGAVKFNESRIIILGEKGAGKTCLARRLIDVNADMAKDNESTQGVNTSIWKLEKEDLNIHIWDFAGHVVTHAVHQFFLSERCLYIMVYDGRSEERNRLNYWLDHMKNYGGNSTAILLVNKRDNHAVDIPINNLKDNYSIMSNNEEGYFTFSIRDDKTELEDFRNYVVQFIQNDPSWSNQQIPSNYYRVKTELEDLFHNCEDGVGEEFIDKEKFETIAKKNDVDNSEALLKDLHALGISLWYDEMEEYNTLVLNPEWISHGVYKIINWVHNEKKHAIKLEDFNAVFSCEESKCRYPEDKHNFLFKLMIHYKLAYETEKGGELIIPHLLGEDRPSILPDFPIGTSLMIRYNSKSPLPPNTISRFIVLHNQQIHKEEDKFFVWRHGVVLKGDIGSIALVREEDRTISISVKGKDQTTFLSTLRDTMNSIFKSYKSKRPDLEYMIEEYGKIPQTDNQTEPLWLSDKKVLAHALQNLPYYDENKNVHIYLNNTKEIYNIQTQNILNDNSSITDNSVNNTFNFSNCNINLQGDLNELARLAKNIGDKESASELEDASKALESVEESKTPEEVKKKGVTKGLRAILEDLGDEKSKIHKTVKGIKRGVGIAQDIAKSYNDIAQWAGLPQVPKPFLKQEKK